MILRRPSIRDRLRSLFCFSAAWSVLRFLYLAQKPEEEAGSEEEGGGAGAEDADEEDVEDAGAVEEAALPPFSRGGAMALEAASNYLAADPTEQNQAS